MVKYLVVYKASKEAMASMQGKSPEESKKDMEPWFAWMEKYKTELVEPGAPVGGVSHVSKLAVNDGHDDLMGYSVLQVENKDEALKIVKENPHLNLHDSCVIDVYELKSMPK
jgi:hypothetical protein